MTWFVAVGGLVLICLLGGLQLNFIWAKRMPYTAYPFDFNTFTYGAPIEVDTSSTEGQFYITYDF